MRSLTRKREPRNANSHAGVHTGVGMHHRTKTGNNRRDIEGIAHAEGCINVHRQQPQAATATASHTESREGRQWRKRVIGTLRVVVVVGDRRPCGSLMEPSAHPRTPQSLETSTPSFPDLPFLVEHPSRRTCARAWLWPLPPLKRGRRRRRRARGRRRKKTR